jgi:hypothetical protein
MPHEKEKYMRYKKVVFIALLIIVIVGCGIWYFGLIPPMVQNQPPTWHGITPSLTTVNEAKSILGEPNGSLRIGPYQYLNYYDREELGWNSIELWSRTRRGRDIIVALLLYNPFPWNKPEEWESPTLAELVYDFGKPDRVTWSYSKYDRYLIWAQKGIAAAIYASNTVLCYDCDEIKATEYQLFEPMSLNQFLLMKFVWYPFGGVGWAPRNLFINSDAPYTRPENPYDWEHMPTPIP